MATGRRGLVLAIGVAVSWPAALVGAARAESTTVTLNQQQFTPKTVQVFTGDTVTWKYESGGQHTVTFDEGPDYNPTCTGLLKTGCLDQPGETVSRTFTQLQSSGLIDLISCRRVMLRNPAALERICE